MVRFCDIGPRGARETLMRKTYSLFGRAAMAEEATLL